MGSDQYKMDGHKLLWHLERVQQWQEKRVIAPIYIEVSPLAYCNNRCIFCAIDFSMEKSLALDASRFIPKLAQMGKAGVRSIMYAGEGEPLLHRELVPIILETKKAGIDVALTTNGNLGSSDDWQAILPALSWVRFSVDAGTDEVYSVVHGVSGEMFHRTIQNIRQAVQFKRDNELSVTIGAQFVVLEENVDDLAEAVALFSEIGVDYLAIKPYSLHPQMLATKEVDYRNGLMDRVASILKTCTPSEKSPTRIIFRQDAMENYADGKMAFDHCLALPFWGYVDSRGDFYTCSVFLGDPRFKVGNVLEQEMEAVLFGEKRENSIQFGEKRLALTEECRLNCRMARINEFLTMIDQKPEGGVFFID
ncbi:MAG: radical SAM protein [Magnetococcales bacterium]|nr:radical SAM protein [Magnetococcales bacterium]